MNRPLQDEPVSPRTPALVVWTELCVGALVLFVGNRSVPEGAHIDFTPFELSGPVFFLLVVPAALLLTRFGYTTVALAIVLCHGAALTVFIGRFIGVVPALLASIGYILPAIAAWSVARRLGPGSSHS